jgi:hypothetical protein
MIVIESSRQRPSPTTLFRSWMSEVFTWVLSDGLWLPNYARIQGVYAPLDFPEPEYDIVGWTYYYGSQACQETRKYKDGTTTISWVRSWDLS